MTRLATSRYASEQQSWNTTQKPKHGACRVRHFHHGSSFSPRFVPVFEREARVKFFVTFEWAFERWCSSDFLVLQVSDRRDLSVR